MPSDKTTITAMCALAGLGMILGTILILNGKSIGDLLALVAVVTGPVLTALISRVHAEVKENNKLANGNLTAANNERAAAERRLFALAAAINPETARIAGPLLQEADTRPAPVAHMDTAA